MINAALVHMNLEKCIFCLTIHVRRINVGYNSPIRQVEGRPAAGSPGSRAPLVLVMHLSPDKPGTGRHAHLERQGLHAAVHAGQLGVEQGRRAETQAFAGVGAGGIDVEHGRRARGEAGRGVGTSQVLQLGVRGDFGREVLEGHARIVTVGVDLVQVSQAGGTAQGLSVQQSRDGA